MVPEPNTDTSRGTLASPESLLMYPRLVHVGLNAYAAPLCGSSVNNPNGIRLLVVKI